MSKKPLVPQRAASFLLLSLFSALAPAVAFALPGAAPRGNPELLAMRENTWLRLTAKGMAKARMYSGACFGGEHLWYFGGAHRSWPGNDVELFDPRTGDWLQATEVEMPARGSRDWKAMTGGGGSTSALSPRGRPYTEHTYQQVCWEPGRRRFFVVLVSSGTWEFDPERREWIHLTNRFADRKADPRGAWAQNHVLYEPAYGAPVLTTGSGGAAAMFRFDHEKRRWRRLGSTPSELKWNEFYSTSVPEWKAHLVSTMKKGFFKFDVARRRLTAIESPQALRRCQSLSYDAANHVVIALGPRKVDRYRQTVTPWVLDVNTMDWRQLEPEGQAPVGQTAGAWATFWYDPHHRVHILINCVRRDRKELFDGGITETWVYRYK